MEFIPTLLYNNDIRTLNIYGNPYQLIYTKISTIDYNESDNKYTIIINKDKANPFGIVAIEVWADGHDSTTLKVVKDNLASGIHKKKTRKRLGKNLRRKSARKPARKQTRRKKTRQTRRIGTKKGRKKTSKKTRKTYNLKGGGIVDTLIKLICIYCFFLLFNKTTEYTIGYTNTIESDAPQMTTEEYINNFDVKELEGAISNSTIRLAENIPVFSQCYDDGKCTTEDLSKEYKKPPIFASVDLVGEKRNETNYGRYLSAFTKMPIKLDSTRGYHKLVKMGYNPETKQLEIKGSRDLDRIEEGNEPPFPKSDKLDELLYASIKDQINAFKERGMTDNSIKEYCVHTFIDQAKPSSYLSAMTSKYLDWGWHHDGMPSVKYDNPVYRDKIEENKDFVADTFERRSQTGGDYEALFAITYDDFNYEDIIRTKLRIVQRGGTIQYVAPHFMGPKRSTFLIDQRVMDKDGINRNAFTQHFTQQSMDARPRTLSVIIVKEIKKGMTCLV